MNSLRVLYLASVTVCLPLAHAETFFWDGTCQALDPSKNGWWDACNPTFYDSNNWLGDSPVVDAPEPFPGENDDVIIPASAGEVRITTSFSTRANSIDSDAPIHIDLNGPVFLSSFDTPSKFDGLRIDSGGQLSPEGPVELNGETYLSFGSITSAFNNPSGNTVTNKGTFSVEGQPPDPFATTILGPDQFVNEGTIQMKGPVSGFEVVYENKGVWELVGPGRFAGSESSFSQPQSGANPKLVVDILREATADDLSTGNIAYGFGPSINPEGAGGGTLEFTSGILSLEGTNNIIDFSKVTWGDLFELTLSDGFGGFYPPANLTITNALVEGKDIIRSFISIQEGAGLSFTQPEIEFKDISVLLGGNIIPDLSGPVEIKFAESTDFIIADTGLMQLVGRILSVEGSFLLEGTLELVASEFKFDSIDEAEITGHLILNGSELLATNLFFVPVVAIQPDGLLEIDVNGGTISETDLNIVGEVSQNGLLSLDNVIADVTTGGTWTSTASVQESPSGIPIPFTPRTFSSELRLTGGQYRYEGSDRKILDTYVSAPGGTPTSLEVALGTLALTGLSDFTDTGIALETNAVLELAGGPHTFGGDIDITGDGYVHIANTGFHPWEQTEFNVASGSTLTLNLTAPSTVERPAQLHNEGLVKIAANAALNLQGMTQVQNNGKVEIGSVGNGPPLTGDTSITWRNGDPATGSTGEIIYEDLNSNVIEFAYALDNTANGAISVNGPGKLSLTGLIEQVNLTALNGGNWIATGNAVLDIPTLVLSVLNGGSLTLAGGGEFEPLARSTDFTNNEGAIGFLSFIDYLFPGDWNNNGLLRVDQSSSLTVEGNFTTQEDSKIQLDGDLTVNTFSNEGGTISGSGNLIVTNLQNNGTLEAGFPGDEPTVDGNLTMGNDSIFAIGINAQGSGTLVVNGAVDLSGTLKVAYADDFQPVPGESYTILEAGSISGTFDRVDPSAAGNRIGYSWQINNNNLILTTSVATYDDYEDWRSTMFSIAEQADNAISGPTADPDGDKILNYLEYFSALRPKAKDSNPFKIGYPSEAPFFNFTLRRATDITDGDFAIERFDQVLEAWKTFGDFTVRTSPLHGGVEEVTAEPDNGLTVGTFRSVIDF
jgi:hypothetical protein